MEPSPHCRCDTPVPAVLCAALCERREMTDGPEPTQGYGICGTVDASARTVRPISHAQRGAGVEDCGAGITRPMALACEAIGAELRPSARGASCRVGGLASISQGSGAGPGVPAGGKPALGTTTSLNSNPVSSPDAWRWTVTDRDFFECASASFSKTSIGCSSAGATTMEHHRVAE